MQTYPDLPGPLSPGLFEAASQANNLIPIKQVEAEMPAQAEAPRPVSSGERSKNPLRPESFAEVIGQEKAVRMMRRVVSTAMRRDVPLDHVLLVGAAGTGKTTFATVIANELGVDCYTMQAPVSHATLLALREVMQDRDVLFIDEIHMQAVQERRGMDASTKPEVFLNLLEDRTIATETGMLTFPDITVIGATTDEGMLPDPFIARFPLRPRLEAYSVEDMAVMAVWNADRLNVKITPEAAEAFAMAARGTPRQVNNYVRNAASLAEFDVIDRDLAMEVLSDLNGVTEDGLTPDMQGMLVFLYTKARHETAAGEVKYSASVNTIATAIGKSRDTKAIALRVEPYLIQEGYVQVGHGGRRLTDAGIARAQQLATGVRG